MSPRMNIDAYLASVAARLAKLGPVAARSLAEIRDHLVDSAQHLVASGATPADAEPEAIRRFGDPRDVAAELAAVLRHERDTVERIFKLISISNLFIAVWGLAAVALLNPTPNLLVATGLVTAVSVTGALACMKRDIEPGTLVVSGVTLVAVGLAGIFWASIGDRVGGAVLGLALLMGLYLVQGVLAIWASVRRDALASELSSAS